MSFFSGFGNQVARRNQDITSDVKTTSYFFYITVVVGVVVIFLHKLSLGAAAVSLLWALASIASGAAVGFLFGIPKILQAPTGSKNGNQDNAEAQQYQQQVNTNLTEISDWLTKIIVGLGLINLKSLPHYLMRLSDTLAISLGSGDVARERAFALAIIVSFGVVGFLFGYLSTRLFLAGAFLKADTSGLRTAQATLEVQMAQVQNNQALVSASYANANVPPVQARDIEPGQQEDGITKLINMATNYMGIDNADWVQRVRLKDASADEMGNYVLKTGISRDQIVSEIIRRAGGDADQRKPIEGLILALATVVNFSPEQGDFARLKRVALLTTRKHVQYRIVLALSRLLQGGQATVNDRDEISKILTFYATTADASLAKLIMNTRLLMESLSERVASHG